MQYLQIKFLCGSRDQAHAHYVNILPELYISSIDELTDGSLSHWESRALPGFPGWPWTHYT